ncbi:MAG TPA: Gfo/Idh/MocA family oxidoreductase [Bacteroidota bacterium]|nr:Gfo/Idh/MocA family oxidoreductase [Bacteroidota bacterium]
MNHVRTAWRILGRNLRWVCDVNASRKVEVLQVSKDIPFTTDVDEALEHEDVEAVIIATPAETHFSLARRALERDKHILVEKPMTLLSSETKELITIASARAKTLMVGHVLLYHPAIVALKKNLGEGRIGRLQYIYSNRLNLGAIRSEENILWSFAPHDISVIQGLTEAIPEVVDAKGASFLQRSIEDTTLTYLRYPDNVHAHIFVSWLHPFKEQRLVVIGDKGMLVFEDSAPLEKLKFYPKGFKHVGGKFEKFDSNYEVIPFAHKEPLEEELRHFFHCVTSGSQPLTDGHHALTVLEILEKAQARLRDP